MTKALDDTRSNIIVTRVGSSPSWYPSYEHWVNNNGIQSLTGQQRSDVIHNEPDKWGRRAPSPWLHSWFRYVSEVGTFEQRVLPGQSAWFNRRSTIVPHLGSFTNSWKDNMMEYGPSPFLQLNVDNDARTRVLNEVAAKKWDLGVTARELKETAGLASSLSQQILAAARESSRLFGEGITREILRSRTAANKRTRYERDLLREGTRKARDRAAVYEACRNQWMQYNFGLRPLARDLSDASYALDHLRGSPIMVRGRAGSSRDYSHSMIRRPTNCMFHFVELVAGSFAVHYAVEYESPTDGVSPLSTLGLDNPWSVGYETARLSWLVDYAIGAGDWISSWTAVNGLLYKSGTRSVIWRAQSSGPNGAQLNEPDSVGWVKPYRLRWSLECGRFEREVLTSPITPAFAPAIKDKLGLTQLANSLFVLSQIAGRRGGRGP